MEYTKLEQTEIYRKAMEEQVFQQGCRYRCQDHVKHLYRTAAQVLFYPYDPSLDLAILCQDVIHDTLPEPKERSAHWMVENAKPGFPKEDLDRAFSMIQSTRDHVSLGDPRLVLLDLSGFAFPEQRREDTERMRWEYDDLGGSDFDATTSEYLSGLLERFDCTRSGLESEAERRFAVFVRDGIEATITDLRETHRCLEI